MADEATTPQDQPQDPQNQVKMQVLGQFIRDMSFENILSQKGVQGEVKPTLQVEVALDAKKRSVENQYEVVSKYKVSSKNQDTDEPLFLLELDYSGIFQVEGVAEEQLHPFLMIECPRMLFPFVRRIVSDATRDGGFPPVNLDLVDFVALYRQEITRRAAEQQAAAGQPN
ncbi:MAG: protein-export chaperone SecB [Maritimibacter sp.]|jgi:preprotein translocase subunit SecB